MADEVGQQAVYEHPWAVRFCHWANAVSMVVLAMSGLQIFSAFPSFGAKVPQADLIERVPEAIRLGGWLGGALQWHFTFMWIFGATAVLYGASQITSGHFRTVLFRPRDVPGVWPMVRYYFLFGPKPRPTSQYNPLQKLAYTSTDWPRRGVVDHGVGHVQACTTLGARLAARRIPHGQATALPRNVRFSRVRPWTSDHGGPARLGQFRVDDYRLEAAS